MSDSQHSGQWKTYQCRMAHFGWWLTAFYLPQAFQSSSKVFGHVAAIWVRESYRQSSEIRYGYYELCAQHSEWRVPFLLGALFQLLLLIKHPEWTHRAVSGKHTSMLLETPLAMSAVLFGRALDETLFARMNISLELCTIIWWKACFCYLVRAHSTISFVYLIFSFKRRKKTLLPIYVSANFRSNERTYNPPYSTASCNVRKIFYDLQLVS